MALRTLLRLLANVSERRVLEQILFAFAGATIGAAALSFPFARPRDAAFVLAAATLASIALETLTVGRVAASHRAYLLATPPLAVAPPLRILRTAAALAATHLLRALVVVLCALPGLGFAFAARRDPRWSAYAETAGAIGVCGGLVVTGVLSAYASRAAAVEGLGVRASIRRSVRVASRSFVLSIAAEGLAVASVIVFAAAHLGAIGLAFAVALRCARDALLSWNMWGTKTPRGRRATAPFALAVVLALVLGRASDATAEVELVGKPSTTGGTAGVLVTTGHTVVEKPAELTPDALAREAFIEANGRLADAEDAAAHANEQLLRFRASAIGKPPTAALLAENEELEDAARAAGDLVTTRKKDLYAIGDGILAKAYGGPYGMLQRNLIDIENTGSFLLGMAESAPTGMVETVKGVGRLATSAYDWITGAPKEEAPPPDPDAERASRILDREIDLETELERIRDGATVNRRDGNFDGEHVIGPLVLGEGALVVGRAGIAIRSAVLAKRRADAAAILARSTARALAEQTLREQAVVGLPKVEGQLAAEAIGQGDQYIPFKLADGREALAYRSRYGFELRDARRALDIMGKEHPGLMPEVYGMARLPNGEPVIVLERFTDAYTPFQRPGVGRAKFLEPLRESVLTEKGYRTWLGDGGIRGHSLDDDYLFLDSSGRTRLALPRRASQFLDLLKDGFFEVNPQLLDK